MRMLSVLLTELTDPSRGADDDRPSSTSTAFAVSVHSFDIFSESCLFMSSILVSSSAAAPLVPEGRGAKEEEALEMGEGSSEEALSRQRAESNELVELLRTS